METLERQQRLFHYKVNLSPERESQTPASHSSSPDETLVDDEKLGHNQTVSLLEKNDETSHHTGDLENEQSDAEE